MPSWILGVSYSHNGAACLLRDGEIHVAIQEERLRGQKRARIRHHLDSLAVRYCLAHAGLELAELDALAVCHFSRATPPPLGLPDHELEPPRRYLTLPHHLGHAFGVFATSGFDEAAVLIIDGQGGPIEHLPAAEVAGLRRGSVPGMARESEVATVYRASRDGLEALEKHSGDWLPSQRQLGPVPRSLLQFGSLGGMYAAASALIFDDPMEAGKVMGLAPYGEADLALEDFFVIDGDGCFRYSDRLPRLLRDLAPWPDNRERFENLAASTQAALERGVLFLAERALALSGSRRLCYAGGVALNSVANEKLLTRLELDDAYIMPSSEDCGAAIGAAYFARLALVGRIDGARVAVDASGRSYDAAERAAAIAAVPFLDVSEPADVVDEAVDRLCAGEIIGWFQDGSELGPRALGWRSILCDPRRADGKDALNARVKHRESFRPFAPAILADHVTRWFDMPERFAASPHMLRVCRFSAEVAGSVPTVEHVDHTGRLQTVTAAANGLFYELVDRFHRRTGVPIVTNTSFNLAGEPIVETPEDALWCLLAADLDAVVLGDQIVEKQASFRSLLDLRPKLGARQVQLTAPVRDGVLRLEAPDTVALWLETPYGAFVDRRRGSDIALLRLCDGNRTGREILEKLGGGDERRFALELARLRRSHVIGFSAAR